MQGYLYAFVRYCDIANNNLLNLYKGADWTEDDDIPDILLSTDSLCLCSNLKLDAEPEFGFECCTFGYVFADADEWGDIADEGFIFLAVWECCNLDCDDETDLGEGFGSDSIRWTGFDCGGGGCGCFCWGCILFDEPDDACFLLFFFLEDFSDFAGFVGLVCQPRCNDTGCGL